MSIMEHLFEIGLANILAIMGLVASLFIWRARDIGKIVERVKNTLKAHRDGAIAGGPHKRNTWLLLVQAGLWVLVLVLSFIIIVYTLEFLSIMPGLYEIANRADITLLEVFTRHMDSIRNQIFAYGMWVSVLLIIEWLLTWCIEFIQVNDESEAIAHLFSIPREWRDAPAEMWHQRLSDVLPAGETVTDEWQKKWTVWIDIVAAVRDAEK